MVEGLLRRLALIGGCSVLMAAAGLFPGQTQDAGEASQASTTVGIDADPTGNAATSLGAIDYCVSVASGTTFDVDIFVADVSDLAGWQATFIYDPSVLLLSDANVDLFLAADPGSRVSDLSEPLPDADGAYSLAFVDLVQPVGENGSGVIARLSLQAAASGTSTLALEGVILGSSAATPIGDIDGDDSFDGPVQNAQVAVDQSCPAAPPATPTVESTLTASPTETETPSTTAASTSTSPATPPASPPPATPPAELTPAPLPHEEEKDDGFPWAVVAGAAAGGVVVGLVLGFVLRRLIPGR